jgi:hypothetical protein
VRTSVGFVQGNSNGQLAEVHVRLLTVVVFLSFCPSAQFAQAQSTVVPCTPGTHVFTPIFTDPISGHPFSATIRTTFEQKLPDASHIHAFTEGHEARASDGMLVIVTPSHCERTKEGELHIRQAFNLSDPVHALQLSWEAGDEALKRIIVFALPSRPPIPWAGGPAKPGSGFGLVTIQTPGEVKTEELGTRKFFGVTAYGFRTTRTIRSGGAGNEVDIEVLYETWQSPELHLVFSTIDDDPRRGRTVMELSSLKFGEPDVSAFAVPANYELIDFGQTGGNLNNGTSTGSPLSPPGKK